MNRTYCKLITREAILRLHMLLPWRPSVFRRARLDVHLDPVTLAFSVAGKHLKVDRDAKGEIKRQLAQLDQLQPWDDPSEVDDAIAAIRLLINEARVWLLENPTRRGVLNRRPGDDEYLLINSDGTPWRKSDTYSTAFRSAIMFATRGHNAHAPDSERIDLPMGWGSLGSYVLRFLYGQRIKQRGGSYQDIADALGNSPMTAKMHYQEEHDTETLMRVAHKLRNAGPKADTSRSIESGPKARMQLLREAWDQLLRDSEQMGLTEDEQKVLWEERKATIFGP